MGDLNKVLLIGNVVKDVELRVLANNTKIANIRLAMHRKYKTKTGELKEETEFITVIVWETLAENCAKYLKQGSRVYVEGRLQTREYKDKEEQQRIVTEVKADTVEFLSNPKSKEGEVK